MEANEDNSSSIRQKVNIRFDEKQKWYTTQPISHEFMEMLSNSQKSDLHENENVDDLEENHSEKEDGEFVSI